MDLSTAGGCKVWAVSGFRLFVLIELQPSRRPDKTGARFGFGSGRWTDGCQFEFGGGSRPLFSSGGSGTGGFEASGLKV